MKHKDGSFIWVRSRGEALRDEYGKPYRMAGSQTDISEEKAIKEKIIDSHRQMVTIFENMEDIVYVVDIESYEILFLNKKGLEVWGNVEGKRCWEIMYNEMDAPCSFCKNFDLFNKGKPKDIVIKSEEYNETHGKWYRTIDRGILWSNNRPAKLQIAYDITENKVSEEILYNEKEKFKTTLFSVGEGVIATDEKGIIQVINKVAENLTGWNESDVIGRPIGDVYQIVDESTKEFTENIVLDVLKSGDRVSNLDGSLLISKEEC